jgi:hypothetical protein
VVDWNGLFNKGAKFAVKLNTKRTMLVGLAFLSICIFWQMYDSVMTLILTDTFHLNETIAGAVMASGHLAGAVPAGHPSHHCQRSGKRY